MAQMTAIT